MMIIKQLSVFVENKTGRMAEITKVIGDANVDIRALSIADTSDFGILRLIVDKPDVAMKALRDAGVTVSLTDVIAIGIDDKPGSFASAIKTISDAGIGIEYMYAFVGRATEQAFLVMRVEETEKAAKIIQDRGIRVLTSKEMFG